MRPIFKYFGSKWRNAKHYPKPLHDIIIEPFAGSASYSSYWVQSGLNASSMLVDANPRICTLWRGLSNATPEQIECLPLDLVEGTDITRMGLEEWAAELIIRWQRVGLNNCTTVSKWNNKPGQWEQGVKNHLARLVPLRWVHSVDDDYTKLPDIEATWFIDPPYQHNVPKYFSNQKPINFAALGEWCKSRKGQVIVCEQDGADWLPFVPFKQSHTNSRGTSRNEVIWTS